MSPTIKPGERFEDLMRVRVFEPADMRNTGFERPRPLVFKRARGYTRMPWGELANAEFVDESFATGAGGMYSTVDDMFRLDRALHAGRLLTQQDHARLVGPHAIPVGYGCNSDTIQRLDGSTARMISGYGGTPGLSSGQARLIDDQHLVLVLCNATPSDTGSLM